jgi:uroporphyrinogen decarboxylase
MTKREVVREALRHRRPPYVPWQLGFTVEAHDKLARYYGVDLDTVLDNHFVAVNTPEDEFISIGDGRFRDFFGVIWDRSVDKDIGNVENCLLPEPDMSLYSFPDPLDSMHFETIDPNIASQPNSFRVFNIGFSLYERAWTLRGVTNLLMDMVERPAFVHELFDTIAKWNITQARESLKYDIDAVYFGDDWGAQTGPQMSPMMWREFIKPVLRRMYSVVKDANKRVMIHSCGKVDEFFDDLVEVGVDCFNPFQPEVMDVSTLKNQYAGRLAFHGGLSTQRTLPYGTVEDVRAETRRLLSMGRDGGYVFAPAHAVEGDVPIENMVAFIEELKSQPGYAG